MKKLMAVLVVATFALSLTLAAFATDQPVPPPQPLAGAGQGQTNPPAGGNAPGNKPLGPNRGYLRITDDTKALWGQLGQLNSDLHQKQWDLFVLLNADTIDRQAAGAKFREIRNLNQQMKAVNDKLQPSWQPFPQGLGKGHGGKHKGGQQGQQGQQGQGQQ